MPKPRPCWRARPNPCAPCCTLPEPQAALGKLLLFARLDAAIQRKVVSQMYERAVKAGDILIKEGDTGIAAMELYVVKHGKFEVPSQDEAHHRRCCESAAPFGEGAALRGHVEIGGRPKDSGLRSANQPRVAAAPWLLRPGNTLPVPRSLTQSPAPPSPCPTAHPPPAAPSTLPWRGCRCCSDARASISASI